MSELHALQLNLHDSSVYYDSDEDEFRSVSGSIGEDQDTYRVLDELLVGTEFFKNNKQEERFVELQQAENSSLEPQVCNTNTQPDDQLFIKRPRENVDVEMIATMDDRYAREIEELRQERNYQSVIKKRISSDMERDKNYSLLRIFDSANDDDDDDDDDNDDNDDNNNSIHISSIDDRSGKQTSNIDSTGQPPDPVYDVYNEDENLYDSLEADEPPQSKEFKYLPSSSNALRPAFNDDNLDQFYPKSHQKEMKSVGPVKGDHMLFSQMWSDEHLYHELKKMAKDYNKNQTLYASNSVQPPYKEQENDMPLLLTDFQGSNRMDYQEGVREKFWNNLSNKPPIQKQHPISTNLVRKPKIVPKASTNYVEYNKTNYRNASQNKSYMTRHYHRKIISGSYSKLPTERQVYSGRSEPIYGREQYQVPLWQKPSSAENYSQTQYAKLIYQMEQNLPPLPGKLQKCASDSRVNYRNSRPHHLPPLLTNEQSSEGVENYQRVSFDMQSVSPPMSSRLTNEEPSMRTFQPLRSFYVNDQENQTVPFENPTHHQDPFLLQPFPSPHREIYPTDDDGNRNNDMDETLNSKTSYVARYKNQRNPKQNYKVYSVEDYRKMQKEVKLGKLGPDLESETLKEKVEKRQKQFEYAKKVHETNKAALKSKRPLSPPKPQRFITEEQQNRRKLAIEYAKSVPKPVVKPSEEQTGDKIQAEQRARENPLPTISPEKMKTSEKSVKFLRNYEDLEQLCLRHEQDKRNAENIRKKIIPPIALK